jgi:hypothetical protein
LDSIFRSGGIITGMDGAVVSFRGPPGTVGVGAASYASLKKEPAANSTCHGAGDGRVSASKLDDLLAKPLLAQRWLPSTWTYPASTLVMLLLLLPLPPLEWRALPGLRCDVSRMLLMRPRPGWYPELLLLRRPRDDILLASSAPSKSELYEYP